MSAKLLLGISHAFMNNDWVITNFKKKTKKK